MGLIHRIKYILYVYLTVIALSLLRMDPMAAEQLLSSHWERGHRLTPAFYTLSSFLHLLTTTHGPHPGHCSDCGTNVPQQPKKVHLSSSPGVS